MAAVERAPFAPPNANSTPISASEPVTATPRLTGQAHALGDTRRSRKTTNPMNQRPSGTIIMKLNATRTQVHAVVPSESMKMNRRARRRTVPPSRTASASSICVSSGGPRSVRSTSPRTTTVMAIIEIAMAANGTSAELTPIAGRGRFIDPGEEPGAFHMVPVPTGAGRARSSDRGSLARIRTFG